MSVPPVDLLVPGKRPIQGARSLAVYVLAGLAALSVVGSAAMLAVGGGPALLAMGRDALVALGRRPGLVTALFAGWALVANCLVVPAGSLSLVVGGALLGAVVPTSIWAAAQLLTAPVLYNLTLSTVRGSALADLAQRYLNRAPVQAAALTGFAAANGVLATALLRLLPIMPNAPAAIIAATSGVPLRSFVLGSLLAGWVRPLYFATLGAAIGSLGRLDAITDLMSPGNLWPLAALFAGALSLVLARLAIGSRA
jgi:uncharacterized membrane protein YdjX (TVP38/TMEM64 family)